jgi:1-aminocyclopropane-1-carboxylate deaminase/D-cysteine desulfhydrase-like pyridoxal-dependent ACC family enzyme
VRRSKREQSERIRDLCSRIAGLLGVSSPVGARDIYLIDEFVAPGYGLLNPPTIESIKLAARHEGLFLDPVYTGKVMAGAIRRARSLGCDKNLVFLHTGGGPGIFGYEPLLTNAMLGS